MRLSHPPEIQLDSYLLLSVGTLMLFGLVMVASASMPVAQHNMGNPYYFLIRQMVFAIIAMVGVVAMLRIPINTLQRFGGMWLVLALILLIAVLIPGIGHEVNGSRRWIHIYPIALQVSEAVKLCTVIYIADYLSRHRDAVRNTLMGVVKPLLVLGLLSVLLLLEPDFGAVVVVFITALGMMFMAGVRLRWFYIVMGLAVTAAVLLVLFSPYRLARLTGFLHPWQNQFDTGYQLTQSLMAFGRGGIFGVGLGNSLQKMFYLPEAYTDFILAVIGEELGLIGVLCVLGLFVVVICRGLSIGRRAHKMHHLFVAYMSYGVTFWLGLQVMVNFGVNIGLLPTKGLTLPFISYGGSSLVIDCIAVAILLRCDLENKLQQLSFGADHWDQEVMVLW